MSSNAVGQERISEVVGYKITQGDFSETTPNLPQRIALLGEANTANQSGLDLTPWEATTLQAIGVKYGFGSPLYLQGRILRPISGDGVGGIPIVIFPQAQASGAASKIYEITPSGVATGNGTHTILIAGRDNVDGGTYDININTGDTAGVITSKIQDAVNNVLGCPVTGDATEYAATLESKWKGLTADGITVSVETNGNDLGITYVVDSVQDGSGTPSIQSAMDALGNQWFTIVENPYGTHAGTMDILEATNGRPDPDAPTGRYAATIMKPFISPTGSVIADPSSITDSRKGEVTIAIAPAPLSQGLPMEAAANLTVILARQAQDEPHLDASGNSYPDMPTPKDIGAMATYNNRDAIVKKGCSTVDLVNQRYVVKDFVTTYHPDGEIIPQFRFVRNLIIDFNVRFGYFLLEQINVVNHVIANDNDVVLADKVIKPKQWVQLLRSYSLELANRALIVNAKFMQNSLKVNQGTSNPDRFETFFRYKRSPFTRIASTTAEAGFNFGVLN